MPLSKKHLGSGTKEAVAAREDLRRQSGLDKNYKPIRKKVEPVEDAAGDPEYYKLMLGDTSNLNWDDF